MQPGFGLRPRAGDTSEPRLPDTGFTGQADDSSRAEAEAIDCLCEGGQLSLPADELRRHARARCCSMASADQSPRRHRLALAFERELADRFEVEAAPGEPYGHLADVGLAGRRGRLEALRENHGVAKHGVVHACLTAEDASDAVPRIDADVQGELRVMGKLAAKAPELRMHLERNAQGTLRIVFVRDGCPEQGEQGIARKLLDVPLVATDDTAQSRNDRVDHLEQLLRIEPVGERREARDVGEESRNQAPFFGELSARLD